MTNDPVPAVEKRMKRSKLVRIVESHTAWYTTNGWDDQRELKSLPGRLFTIMWTTALLSLFVCMIAAGDQKAFPTDIFLTTMLLTSAPFTIYWGIIPQINTLRFPMPRHLSKEQREAINTFEDMDPSDRSFARDALYEFIRETRIESEPYCRKHAVWKDTLSTLDVQRDLVFKLEAVTPSPAEQTLNVLQQRNDEIREQLESA